MKLRLIGLSLCIALLGLLSCQNCKKFENESYKLEINEDFEAMKIHIDSVNRKIEETDYTELDYESYRLIYSSGQIKEFKLLRIDRTNNGDKLTYKEFSSPEYMKGEFAVTYFKERKLLDFQWDYLENLIYEYDFWTADLYRVRTTLGGNAFILEGNRPQAEMCNKKVRNIVMRGSPTEDDEIGQLCLKIIEYVGEQ